MVLLSQNEQLFLLTALLIVLIFFALAFGEGGMTSGGGVGGLKILYIFVLRAGKNNFWRKGCLNSCA